MAYDPYTWADGPEGGTPIVAERLNHMETGIATAQETAETAAGGVGSPGPAGIIRVNHGLTASTPRPHEGAPIVLWVGSVVPTNADQDLDLVAYE